MHKTNLALIFALFFSGSLLANEPIKPSIVGGTESDPNVYPWMIALVRLERDSIEQGQFCGGMLIHPLWILTAAHCVEGQETGTFEVAVSEGDLNGQVNLYQTDGSFIHPEADLLRISRGMDIALIRLRTPITDVEPVPLERAASALAVGRRIKTLGWGQTSYTSESDTTSAILKEVDAIIAEIDEEEDNHPIYDYFIKTDGLDPIRGTYSGDSGGPMLIQNPDDLAWRVAGVTSFGRRNVSQNQNANYFAKIAYAAPWIDSIIAHPYSTRPAIKPIERIVPGIMHNGELKVGYKFWPFADGPKTNLWRAGTFYLPDLVNFQLDDPHHIYLGDGSFLYADPGFSQRGQKTNSSIMQLHQLERKSYGNAPIPLRPFQRAVGRSPSSYDLSFDKNGLFFILEGLIPGKSYVYPSRHRIYAARTDKFEYIAPKQGSLPFISPTKFTAEEGTIYLLGVNEFTPGHSEYEVGIMPYEAHKVAIGSTTSGTLATNSHPYGNSHKRVELLEIVGTSSGEVRIELYSEFDAEMQLYTKSTAEKIGYYDIGIEGETETFIVASSDLETASLALFNFDKDIYGNFSASAYTHANPPLDFDTDLQFAVTKADSAFNSSNGDTVHYERFIIYARPDADHTLVSTYVPYANLGVAVYDGDNLVDFHYGRRYGQIEFESDPDSEYEIYVYDFENYRNVNFELTLSDSTGPTLSDSSNESGSQAFSKKRKQPDTISHRLDPAGFAQLLREHETQRASASN